MRPLAQPVECVESWEGGEVQLFSTCVVRSKGVVDALSADHLTSTFGAVRLCAAQRQAAVRCTADLFNTMRQGWL